MLTLERKKETEKKNYFTIYRLILLPIKNTHTDTRKTD